MFDRYFKGGIVLDRNSKLVLSILLGSLFIAFMGIGLVIPVFPKLMVELNVGGKTVGLLTAMFALTQLIASPLTGKATDYFGRKIMIVIGLLIFGGSESLFAIGDNVTVLYISRALGGISAAFIMPAVSAFIADITTDETRPKAYGYMSAKNQYGFNHWTRRRRVFGRFRYSDSVLCRRVVGDFSRGFCMDYFT